ncbi:hypothetical protein [Actinomadura miaoliensis]|uniref:DNA-binding protein n=1 Tax=Actinomadura miaoliensis TaxID=430685 RepID=A0ABP7W908_9ACTN
MSQDPPKAPDPINLAQIGRLAGVGRAAVVTWRRRHPDFPEPIGGTSESPVFRLADVSDWLIAHKFPAHWPSDQAPENITEPREHR